VPGTENVTALKRLNALKFTHQSAVDSTAIRGQGIKTPTGVDVQKESSTFNVSGVNCFNAFGAILDSVLCLPVIDQPDNSGAPTAWRRKYSPAARAEDTRATYTGVWGDPTEQVEALYAFFNSWTLGIKRGGLDFGTSMMARKEAYGLASPLGNERQTITVTGSPTGGSFSFIFDGKTVAGIPYNVTAGALQTTLDTNFGTGQFVVTGGPLPGTPIVIDFRGRYAFFDQPLITFTPAFTGGSTPAIAAAETIKGAAEIPTVVLPTRGFDIYADDTWAGLGGSKLLAAYAGNLNLADKFVPDWTINSANTSFAGIVEAEDQDRSGSLVLGFDATARALISTFSTGARKFFRFLVQGPLIGNATFYKLQVDFCAQILKPTDTGSTDSVVTKSFDLVNSYDPISGKFLEVELVNTVASY
jgi:hypothetical protein